MDISSNHSNLCIECRGLLAAAVGAVVAVGTAVEWDTLCGTTRATVTCVDGNRVTLAHADGAFFAVEPALPDAGRGGVVPAAVTLVPRWPVARSWRPFLSVVPPPR